MPTPTLTPEEFAYRATLSIGRRGKNWQRVILARLGKELGLGAPECEET